MTRQPTQLMTPEPDDAVAGGTDEPVTALALAPVEPLAVDTAQAARLIGVSRSMFCKLAASGQIGPAGVRLGKCVRFPLAEMREWAAAGMPQRHEWIERRKQQK